MDESSWKGRPGWAPPMRIIEAPSYERFLPQSSFVQQCNQVVCYANSDAPQRFCYAPFIAALWLMIESFYLYATAKNSRALVFSVSLILALVALVKLARAPTHLFLKIVSLPILLVPVIGPIIVVWIMTMPSKQPKDLRASMNHYGQGGRFIGNGSGKLTYSDFEDEAPDRPVKFKALFWRKGQ